MKVHELKAVLDSIPERFMHTEIDVTVATRQTGLGVTTATRTRDLKCHFGGLVMELVVTLEAHGE